jgi:hypothetical protein
MRAAGIRAVGHADGQDDPLGQSRGRSPSSADAVAAQEPSRADPLRSPGLSLCHRPLAPGSYFFLTTTGLGWQQRTSTAGLTNTSLALRLPEVERPSKVTPVWLVPAPMPAAR